MVKQLHTNQSVLIALDLCQPDNSSEIYSKKCGAKNCKSECEFKGLKNNKLSYNYKESRKTN